MDLNTIWFVLVGVLLTGYAVLDGFDLGTGLLLPCARDDHSRRIFLNAIGPIWNGNEVWLVVGGGALFAAFPEVYATVFSGFYDAFMLLLFALIFRAVAIEFRGQLSGSLWRSTWDVAFAVASGVVSLILGVGAGNIVWGIPLNNRHDFQGDFLTLLGPYPLLAGVTSMVLMIMHANLFLILKTEGALQNQLRQWARWTVPAHVVCFTGLCVTTVVTAEHLRHHLHDRWLVMALLATGAVAAAFNVLRELNRAREGRAFLSSCASIVAVMALFGVTIYPNMVISRPDLDHTLTIYNGSATEKSLAFMFVVAVIGVPFVLAYTASIYYLFRGKVVITEDSY